MKNKVPQVTFAFWLIKIAATTLGETGGDAFSRGPKMEPARILGGYGARAPLRHRSPHELPQIRPDS